MQSLVPVSKSICKPQVKPEYLGFQTIVNQVVYPIAVIKFNGKDAYCWDWMRSGPGYLAHYMDFTTGRAGSFGKYEESHVSYHESGTHQSSITGKASKLYLAKHSVMPVAQIQMPISFTSIPAPLTSPLPHIMKIPEWKRAIKKVTLRPDDFAGQSDIYLRVYLCRKEHTRNLAKPFHLATWVLGFGSVRLVIAADPVM